MKSNRQHPYSIERPDGQRAVGEECITIEQLHHLVRLIDQSDVAELEVKHVATNARVMLRKATPLESVAVQAEVATLPEEAPSLREQAHYTITAPLVGLFRRSIAKASPLLIVGDNVKEGQHIGSIQSLNIPNEVEAPVTGRIIEILVEDNQPVEYGQPLLTLAT